AEAVNGAKPGPRKELGDQHMHQRQKRGEARLRSEAAHMSGAAHDVVPQHATGQKACNIDASYATDHGRGDMLHARAQRNERPGEPVADQQDGWRKKKRENRSECPGQDDSRELFIQLIAPLRSATSPLWRYIAMLWTIR